PPHSGPHRKIVKSPSIVGGTVPPSSYRVVPSLLQCDRRHRGSSRRLARTSGMSTRLAGMPKCQMIWKQIAYAAFTTPAEASSPVERVWQLNAQAPVIAIEAAAAEGVRRVVLTSTVSAIGLAEGDESANERASYPKDWLGLVYPDSKHAGESAAREAASRHG